MDLQKLPHPDDQHLQAAEGWLGLGNGREAAAELDAITPQYREHPFVLEMRYKICEQAGQWEQAVLLAEKLRAVLPDSEWGHFYLAYSLHELKRTQAAYETLATVVENYPGHFLMRYNLACYACQLGRSDEALTWLQKSFALADKKELRAMALADLDLKPLWSKIKKL